MSRGRPDVFRPIKPTDKQIAFVKDVQETFDPVKSVENIYGRSREGHVAHVQAGLVMKSEGVRALMNDVHIGLSDDTLLKKLKQTLEATKERYDKHTKEFVEVPDWAIQIKALELAFKLKGYLSSTFSDEAEEKFKQITVNFNLVKARDTTEVKKLLGDMPSLTARDAVLREEKKEEKIAEI